jgi:hypothetical protein
MVMATMNNASVHSHHCNIRLATPLRCHSGHTCLRCALILYVASLLLLERWRVDRVLAALSNGPPCALHPRFTLRLRLRFVRSGTAPSTESGCGLAVYVCIMRTGSVQVCMPFPPSTKPFYSVRFGSVRFMWQLYEETLDGWT